MKECRYYNKLSDNIVVCVLCPRNCKIKDGYRGYCRSRFNEGGILYTENDSLSALALDPIEKKPLFKFYPTSNILSVGGSGCNFRCPFCQNWHISQCENRNHIKLSPEELVQKAEGLKKSRNIGLAYTYSDPIVMFEYVMEAAQLIREKGMQNVFISNGYINEEPLKDLFKYMDAFNIDVKAFTKEKYQAHFKADFAIIKKNLELIVKNKIHLEITCLIVPGINDNIEEAEKFFKWIAQLNPQIPLHLSRYYPNYNEEKPATDISLLKEMKGLASLYIKNVYVGNI